MSSGSLNLIICYVAPEDSAKAKGVEAPLRKKVTEQEVVDFLKFMKSGEYKIVD